MKKTAIFLLIVSALLTGCQENTDNGGSTRLTFRLTDAPAHYDKVNIEIIGAQAIINGNSIDLNVKTGVYNLLDFANGKDTVIVDQEIPSGELSQIRLILGENNTIHQGEYSHDLTTPSAQQSGLKLNVHNTFVQGVAYEYVIDFDAAKSIVTTGSGKYILKPVLRVFTKAVSGGLEGVVSPVKAKPLIWVISSQLDSLSTYADTLSGSFAFRGLNEGIYKLSVIPQSPYNDTLLTNITVNTGAVTKLDTIKLN
jgi:hypothetical protein